MHTGKLWNNGRNFMGCTGVMSSSLPYHLGLHWWACFLLRSPNNAPIIKRQLHFFYAWRNHVLMRVLCLVTANWRNAWMKWKNPSGSLLYCSVFVFKRVDSSSSNCFGRKALLQFYAFGGVFRRNFNSASTRFLCRFVCSDGRSKIKRWKPLFWFLYLERRFEQKQT